MLIDQPAGFFRLRINQIVKEKNGDKTIVTEQIVDGPVKPPTIATFAFTCPKGREEHYGLSGAKVNGTVVMQIKEKYIKNLVLFDSDFIFLCCV